jgi:hypothetical protein
MTEPGGVPLLEIIVARLETKPYCCGAMVIKVIVGIYCYAATKTTSTLL